MKERWTFSLLAACALAIVPHSGTAQRTIDVPITVRPATLADAIEELAGYDVEVPYARVVGVLNPRVLVVDTATSLRPVRGNRDRVLVFVASGALKVPPTAIVGSTVRISGVARTLLGMQVTGEVPWPSELRPDVVERLEIRGAVQARSVRTSDGVELTSASVGR
jgi:hypothetical protein